MAGTRTVAAVMTLVVVMAFVAPTYGMSNELDYGNWNYREGAGNVDVTHVRSVTRVLDSWGKKIFNEIKTLLHSQPSTLLPDYSRVRPLSESLNDLFREVLHLQRRITDLNHRLATLEPVLRRYGYRARGEEDDEEEQQQKQEERMMMEERGKERGRDNKALAPQGGHTRRGGANLARYPRKYTVRTVRPLRRVVRTRRVRVYKDKDGRMRVLENDGSER